MKKRLKINGIIIFCTFLLSSAFPAIFLRIGKVEFLILDQIMEIFGITFILLGQLLRVSARGFKSEYSQNSHALIKDGPYMLVRNPMYLGIFLIGLGIVLVLFKLWVLCAFVLIFAARYILLIYKEEKKLKNLFPKDYPDYQKKVPRIFPSPATLSERDISEYLPLKLSWVKKEIGPILTVLFLTLFIESWEDIIQKDIAIYLKETAAYLAVLLLFIIIAIYLSVRTAYYKKDASDKSQNTL